MLEPFRLAQDGRVKAGARRCVDLCLGIGKRFDIADDRGEVRNSWLALATKSVWARLMSASAVRLTSSISE
jgi:hypothetical protein